MTNLKNFALNLFFFFGIFLVGITYANISIQLALWILGIAIIIEGYLAQYTVAEAKKNYPEKSVLGILAHGALPLIVVGCAFGRSFYLFSKHF